MASHNLTGFLRDPLGEFSKGDKIKFTHISTTGEVIKGSTSVFKVAQTGEYNINIEYGNVVIETLDAIAKRWINHGVVTINQDTIASTLPALLNATIPASNELILQLEALLTDAENAAAQAEAARDIAISSAAVEAISGGKLVLIPDNFGQLHLVRRFSPFTYEDLNIANCPFTGVMDAFKRQDGSIRPYIDVAVHEMCNVAGKAASVSGAIPWVNINTDYTRARCEELGSSYMMAGRYVAAMLGWLMISKGFQPRGNTEYGRSHSHTNEFGRRVDGRVPNDRNGSAAILAGTGPDEWRHDGTAFGVSNWVGNVWERDEGWKLVDGEIIVSEYMGQPEADWVATGRYINTGNKFSMTQQTSGSGSQTWNLFTKNSDYVGHELLQRLLIEPIDCTKVLGGRFYYNLAGERFPLRGGGWGDAADAGPAAVFCDGERSYSDSIIGGRFASAS